MSMWRGVTLKEIGLKNLKGGKISTMRKKDLHCERPATVHLAGGRRASGGETAAKKEASLDRCLLPTRGGAKAGKKKTTKGLIPLITRRRKVRGDRHLHRKGTCFPRRKNER